jgi:hypothetical protein
MHVTDEELAASLSEQLGGQPLTHAVYARVDTPVGFTRMLTPLGNYFIARPAARSAAKKVTAETDVPLDAAVVLGLSDMHCTCGAPIRCSTRSTTNLATCRWSGSPR